MAQLECKAALSVDETGAITGMAWPFGSADRVGDIVKPGAFANVAAPLPMLASHDQKDVVGVWEEIRETAEGLTVKGRLLVESVARAAEVRALIHAGAMRGLSIGFSGTKALPRRGGGREISGLDLHEISIVSVPANPGARITSIKEMDMTDNTEMPDLATLQAQLADLDKKADTSALTARLDKFEAKMNRLGTSDEPKGDDTERKSFIEYLRTGSAEAKALTTSADTANHVLAPEQIESEFIRNLVEFSPIRQIADVRSTSAAKIILPHRTNVTNAVWVGETTQRTGSEPAFDQAELDVKELATFVDISLQLAEDSANVLTEVNLALAEDFGQKESAAFVNGALALEPKGFMANADIVTTDNGHAATLSPDALVAMMYALPATYRQAGTWVMNGTTLGIIRTLKDGDGRYLWQPSYQAGQPETILGRPVVEAVDMPDIAADAEPIIFGDFKRGYRIYDRLSLAVLADPYTVRVNGLMRYHARRRVAADVVRPTAFRKLVMAV